MFASFLIQSVLFLFLSSRPRKEKKKDTHTHRGKQADRHRIHRQTKRHRDNAEGSVPSMIYICILHFRKKLNNYNFLTKVRMQQIQKKALWICQDFCRFVEQQRHKYLSLIKRDLSETGSHYVSLELHKDFNMSDHPPYLIYHACSFLSTFFNRYKQSCRSNKV